MFEACLNLPHDRREATLLADQLDALARALRDWPTDAWRAVMAKPAPDAQSEASGVFERLVASTAPVAVEPSQRERALQSAQAVADVLRVLWPEVAAPERRQPPELVGAVSSVS